MRWLRVSTYVGRIGQGHTSHRQMSLGIGTSVKHEAIIWFDSLIFNKSRIKMYSDFMTLMCNSYLDGIVNVTGLVLKHPESAGSKQTNTWIRFNTLRPKHGIFKCIILTENVQISIQISLKFVPKDPINNITALIQIMAWCRPGASYYLNQWWLVYWRILYIYICVTRPQWVKELSIINQLNCYLFCLGTIDGPFLSYKFVWIYCQSWISMALLDYIVWFR